MYTDFRIGHNIRYLAYKFGFYIQDLIKLTCTDIINRVYDEWKPGINAENVRIAVQVKEVLVIRDQMDERLLERGKINDIINYRCTEKCICM